MIDANKIDNMIFKRIAEEVNDVFNLTSCDVSMLTTSIARISGMIDFATDIKNQMVGEPRDKREREDE